MSYKNILLIDDDNDDIEIFVEAVNSLHKEIVCQTSSNALKTFEELKTAERLPDFIFVDFNMPALNGISFIQKMKNQNRLEHIPVILMSTHTADVMCQLTKQFETINYMTKPNSFQELVVLLDGVLAK
jgi:CheY-like chemotaxis protein|nr:response regulator [uncultured Flavobacterium sp.]